MKTLNLDQLDTVAGGYGPFIRIGYGDKLNLGMRRYMTSQGYRHTPNGRWGGNTYTSSYGSSTLSHSYNVKRSVNSTSGAVSINVGATDSSGRVGGYAQLHYGSNGSLVQVCSVTESGKKVCMRVE